jgi:hypothetical protein
MNSIDVKELQEYLADKVETPNSELEAMILKTAIVVLKDFKSKIQFEDLVRLTMAELWWTHRIRGYDKINATLKHYCEQL